MHLLTPTENRMCIAPLKFVTKQGEVRQVACHKCKQCVDLRVLDVIGRNIAESKTAVAAHCVTLTYGNNPKYHGASDHPSAVLLTYADVQKFFKRLRKAGYKFSYFIAGEFGSLKGRTHWHGMIYWYSQPPRDIVLRTKKLPYWAWADENNVTRGFVFWDKVGIRAVRYACKYINKDQTHSVIKWSKRPAIGARYVERLAEKYVEQGIAPQTLEYSFPEIKDKKGAVIRFRMRDYSAELFLTKYVEKAGENRPRSRLVDEFLDPELKAARVLQEGLDEIGPITNLTTADERITLNRLLWLKQQRQERQEAAAKRESGEQAVREMNPIVRKGPQNREEWWFAVKEWEERVKNGETRSGQTPPTRDGSGIDKLGNAQAAWLEYLNDPAKETFERFAAFRQQEWDEAQRERAKRETGKGAEPQHSGRVDVGRDDRGQKRP
ncbi:replication initiation protein [Tortoise microvirus 76]|nr:replication initiation protein [Tortoise microvirus 76]